MAADPSQAFISVELDPTKIEYLRSLLAGVFHSLRINVERVSSACHVSLAYIQDLKNPDALEDIALRLAQQPFEATLTGVEILRGQTTAYDYVVLDLASGNYFANAAEEISSELPVKRFAGGFKTHVSLFQIPKGQIEPEALDGIARYLTDVALAHDDNTHILGRVVSIYNTNRERQMAIPIARLEQNF